MGPNFDAIHPTVAEIWVSAARGGVFILRAVGKTVKPHPEWVDCLSWLVDRAIGKQARKNCLLGTIHIFLK